MRFKRILIGFIFYAGCHPNEQTTQPLASTTTDSTHEVSVEQKHDKPVLKDMEINEKEIFRKMATSPELNDDEKKRLAIAVIDSMVIGTYHILDTVFHNSNSMILLLARKYAEENIAWLANYTNRKIAVV